MTRVYQKFLNLVMNKFALIASIVFHTGSLLQAQFDPAAIASVLSKLSPDQRQQLIKQYWYAGTTCLPRNLYPLEMKVES